MPTLLLSPAGIDDTTTLWRAAQQLDWAVERLQGWRIPEWLSGDDFIIYGEGLFVEMVADHFNLALIQAPLDWLVHLPSEFLKRKVVFITLADAKELDTPYFIKPAQGKSFNAQVYQSGTELNLEEHIPDDTSVLVAEPVTWDIEFRCFILAGKIMTLSPYFRNGELVVDDNGSWLASEQEWMDARSFCEEIIATVALPPATVLDVGIIQERGWAVLEANPAWASGIYGCDPAQVLATIQRACVPDDEIMDIDKRWILAE